MRNQIEKLSEYYGQPYTSLTQRPPIEIENFTSNWNYAVQLTECMMRVSLISNSFEFQVCMYIYIYIYKCKYI